MEKQLNLPTPVQMQKKAQKLIPVVNAYIMARAFAETQRAAVDEIDRKVLKENQFFADRDTPRAEGQRITEPKQSYMMHDQDFLKYCAIVREELERAGFRVKQGYNKDGSLSTEKWNYLCPALTAENLQRQAERVLVNVAAKELNLGDGFFDKLVCSGLDNLKLFIDLNCRLVVSLPNYKRPSLQA